MLGLLDRLKEPSTYIGLVTGAVAWFGVAVSPELAGSIAMLCASVASVALILIKEKPRK